MSFREYLLEQEFDQYNNTLDEVIRLLESNILVESILDDMTSKFKDSVKFIKDFASLVKVNLTDMLKLFKDKFLFSFFSKIGWSLSELVKIVKKGYKLWGDLHNIVAKYIADSGIVKFTHEELQKLDAFLQKHPMIKRAGSLVVIGFLIYQWTRMISFTGDVDFDFDQTTLFNAIQGNYSLADLFASPDGIKMLTFIATGVLLKLSFPWPGSSGVLFLASLFYTVVKKKHPAMANNVIKHFKTFKTIKNEV